MKKIVILILLSLVSLFQCERALCSPSAQEAPKKPRIELGFVGNTVFSSSWLRSFCAVDENVPASQLDAKVRERVLSAYRDAAYFGASVESTAIVKANRGERLLTFIREGKPARLGNFKFSGNKRFSSEELASASGLKEGTAPNRGLLDKSLSRMVVYMADRGFPFAGAKIGDFRLEGDSLVFVFVISEGPLCTVSEVALENSTALNRKALARAVGIEPGEKYSEKKVRRGLEYLERTSLFSQVGEPVVTLVPGQAHTEAAAGDEGAARIGVPVRDRRTSSASGVLGFRGRTNEVTGGISLSLLNIAGTGRSAKTSWEASGGHVSSFYLAYAEPWTMGLPFTSSLSFEQTIRDTLFSRTAFGVTIKVPISSIVSAEAGSKFEKTLNSEGPRTRATRLAWLGGLEVATGGPVWSSENSFLLTLEGTRGDKTISHLSENRKEKDVFSTISGRMFLQRRFGRTQIGLADVKASAITEGLETAAPDELFALGGKRTLRGYSERQFLAPTVASVQFEYGVVVGEEGGRVFAFVDCGYASSRELTTLQRIHAGYGIGLKVPSPIGIAGIDFGVASGESIGSGKVHVGLEGTF